MTHWFVASTDELKHKLDVLARHCEAEGRDPSTITRTVGAPVTLVGDEREARGLAERIPPDRLANARPMVPERAAQVLGDWMAAGAQGFTFRNPNLSTPELLDLAGELKRLLS
jgi:alkanesulfonate monooxygenase SsuD/methylene tetrahydromethanopterin reductase-like flavin-dependent oxidoreductase (luciferase family)